MIRPKNAKKIVKGGFGQGARLAIQAAAFLLVARHLGPKLFGVFVSGQALLSMVAPLVDLGSYQLTVREVSRGLSARRAAAVGIAPGLLALGPCTLASVAISLWLDQGMDVGALVVFASGTFIGSRLLAVGKAILIADDRFGAAGLADTLGGFLLLGAAFATVTLDFSVGSWACAYGASTALAGYATYCIAVKTCSLRIDFRGVRRRASEGLVFAVGYSAQNAASDLDKVMLASLASDPVQVGVYAASMRILNVALVPFGAIVAPSLPDFSRAVDSRESFRLIRALLRTTLTYAALSVAAVMILASSLAWLLGSEYSEAPAAIRLMSILLPLLAVHLPLADALTGLGKQHIRTAAQLAGLATMVPIAALAIPLLGWRGGLLAVVSGWVTNIAVLVAGLKLVRHPTQEATGVSR